MHIYVRWYLFSGRPGNVPVVYTGYTLHSIGGRELLHINVVTVCNSPAYKTEWRQTVPTSGIMAPFLFLGLDAADIMYYKKKANG